MKAYKIIVPKPGASSENGMDVRLYHAGEIVEAKAAWQQELMAAFAENGWAMEVKVAAPAETGAPVNIAETIQTEVAPRRRRGRPRKNPISE